MTARRDFLRVIGSGAGIITLADQAGATSSSPKAWFDVSTATPSVNETVTFDASGSYDSDGSIQKYEWYFEGSYTEKTGEVIHHSFQRAGEVAIHLTVTDEVGNTDRSSQTLSVTNDGPMADFRYEPANPQPGDTVRFDATPSTDPDQNIESYSWSVEGSYEWGSGETYAVQFESEGDYEVTLVVEDSQGLEDQKTVVVPVGNARPTASFEYSPSPPIVDEPVTFSAATSTDTDGYVDSYSWKIASRGLSGKGEEATFTFSETARLLVELQIVDDDGVSDVHREYVRIRAQPTTTTTTQTTTQATSTKQTTAPTATETQTATTEKARSTTAPTKRPSTTRRYTTDRLNAFVTRRVDDIDGADIGIGSALFAGVGIALRQWRRRGGEEESTPTPSPPWLTETRAPRDEYGIPFGGLATTLAATGPPKFRPSTPPLTVAYDQLSKDTEVATWPNATLWEAHYREQSEVVLLAEFDEATEQFEAGVEAWQSIDSHENVGSVLNASTDPTPWVVTEYATGAFEEYAGALPPEQTLWSLGAIANGLHHAHTEGVLHLGLTPPHVRFLEPDGDNWSVPTVAGFGLATSDSPEGSSPYNAPEQRDDSSSVDGRTDVFRLAAVGYELLTGRPPEELAEGGTVAPPSAKREAIPTTLDDAFERALARDPDRRHDTVLEFRSALESAYETVGGTDYTRRE